MPKESLPRSKSGRIMDYLVNRSNIGKPFRAVKKLMDDPPSLTGPIRPEDIERSFDAAGLASIGSLAGKRPRLSLGTGGRPYKVSGAQSQVKVTQPKPGTSKFIGPTKPKAKAKEAPAPAAEKSSTPRYRVSGSQQTYTGSKPKPGSKNFIGPTRATQPGEKGFIGPTRPPRSGDKDFIGPTKPASEKKGMSTEKKVGIAGAATGAITGGYIATRANQPKQDAQTKIEGRKEYPGSNKGNRTAPEASTSKSGFGSRISERAKLERLRATRAALDKKPAESPYIPKPSPKPEKSDVKSAEGKTSQSSGAKTVKSASDKSRLAPKTTNFERMKARQFEKEGYAGRSLTRAQAQKLAGAKSGSNTSSLMSLFGISKKKTETPKATSKRTGPLKSAFAQISYQGRKK